MFEENFLKQCDALDTAIRYGGRLQTLAQEIVRECRDEHVLKIINILSEIGQTEDKKIQELVRITRLSFIQLQGQRVTMEACHRASLASDDPYAEESLQDCLLALNRLIGLEQVKESVKNLISYQQIQLKRAAAGLSRPKRTLHLAFTGNPGTGKTTVARIVGRMYRHLGLLSKGHFIEASRTDLIAGYQGQTAQKVRKLVDRAKGGVLFIDEAYSITENEHSDSYGRECLTELTKALEDYRQDLVVIVAGYTGPMNIFFDSNPGLRSRFNTFIEFPDFNEKDLHAIFSQMCSQDDYILGADADATLQEMIHSSVGQASAQFSNGRFVRNLYENALMRHAERVSRMDNPTIDDLKELRAIDLQPVSHTQG